MRTTFTVHHNEHVSSRLFEEVVNAFESAVGSVEDIGSPVLLASTKSAEQFETSVQCREGSSGFMRFLTVNHGAWLARIGLNAKARVYTIGNPLIARTILQPRKSCMPNSLLSPFTLPARKPNSFFQ